VSDKPRSVRRTLIEILRRAKRERDYLVAEIAENRRVMLKQSAFIREQQALIRKQDAALREMADGMREMKEMATRHRLLNIALDVKREESPLQ
jgi:hypothetical protein